MLILAVVLVAIAGAVVYFEPDKDDKSEAEQDPDATADVWKIEPDDVVGIRIARNRDPVTDTVVFEKDGNDWKMTEPFPWRADGPRVGRVLDSLRDVKKGVPIEDADNAEVFGLSEPPVARVTVTLKDGETQTLDVGKEAPIGYRTYVRSADGGIAAAGGNLTKGLLKAAKEYRDTRMLRFDPARVERVTLRSVHGTLSVEKGEGHLWWSKGFTRADPDRVDDLVLGLLDLRFDTFLDDAVTGTISDPTRVVTVETDDTRYHLLVGQKTPMGTLVQTPDATGTAYPEVLALLGQGPTDVGDPFAFPFDPERGNALHVRLGPKSGTWTMDGKDWTIDGLPDITVPPAVDQARIHYTLQPRPPLEEDWGEVKIVADSGTAVVRIGQQIGEDRVAIDTRGGSPYLIPVADLQAIADGIP